MNVKKGDITQEQQKELSELLSEVLQTVREMRRKTHYNTLTKHEQDANDWLIFLNNHTDCEELESLHDAIAKAFVYEYHSLNYADNNELDKHRLNLIENAMKKFSQFIYIPSK